MNTQLITLFVATLALTNILCEESNVEKQAAKAIEKLVNEKIKTKFLEAATEVKGTLVHQLGETLKEAHTNLAGKANKKKKKATSLKTKGKPKAKLMKSMTQVKNTSKLSPPLGKVASAVAVGAPVLSHRTKCIACDVNKKELFKTQIGAAVHQNKGPRHRKHSGTAAMAPPPQANHNNQGGNQQNSNSLNMGMPLPGKQQQQQQNSMNSPMQQQQPQQQQQNLPALQSQMQQPTSNQMPPMMQMAPQAPCMNSACAQQVPMQPMPPPMCGPSCDNNCCMSNQAPPPLVCPASCHLQCFSYCPSKCCKSKKKDEIEENVTDKK